jgi:predicted RNase H-like nuclease (RuvC/YqgF family)
MDVPLLPDPMELFALDKSTADRDITTQQRSAIQTLQLRIISLERTNEVLQSENSSLHHTVTQLSEAMAKSHERDSAVINQLQNSETRLIEQLTQYRSNYEKYKKAAITEKSKHF